MRVTVIAAAVLALWVGGAQAQDGERRAYEESKLAAKQVAGLGPVANLRAPYEYSGYHVVIGVYGAYNPTIDSSVTWLNLACMSTPGRAYEGFSLMYVDVALFEEGELVWDSSEHEDRGICDINRGVDTTFIEVPRSLNFDFWDVFVTVAEQRDKDVYYTKMVFPVQLYE